MPDTTPARSDRATEEAASDGVDRIQHAWVRERPGTPVASIGVISRIWRIGKLLAEERQRTLSRLGVDAATLDLLATLRRSGSPYRLSPTDIARAALVSRRAISQRVARAESSGWVRRLRHGPDGRSVLVELTGAGHALVEHTVDELLAHEQALLSGLTSSEQHQLAGLLRTLLADLGHRLGVDDRPSAHAANR
ncbi:MAG: MarR family winged helix-turn-helix transcriptional regulator [Jiangellaceae bacterium]